MEHTVRTSAVVRSLFAGDPGGRVSIRDIRDALEDRAFGFLLIVFALPNLFPGPPGLSGVLGTPMCLLALQMVFGMRRPWLPQVLLNRSFQRGDFAAVMGRAVPWLEKAERFLRPRLPWMNGRPMDRFAGLMLLIASFTLALPIPLANPPPAIAAIVIALGLIEQDGVAIAVGVVIAVLSVLWAGAILLLGYEALSALFGWAGG